MSEVPDPFDALTPQTGYLHPFLRRDLKISHENTGKASARFRIVDPVSGKPFIFSEQEHFLCQAADGTASLREIHARQAARFDPGMSAHDVMGFFRRLHILGLLAPEGQVPATAPATKPGSGLRGGGLRGEALQRRRNGLPPRSAGRDGVPGKATTSQAPIPAPAPPQDQTTAAATRRRGARFGGASGSARPAAFQPPVLVALPPPATAPAPAASTPQPVAKHPEPGPAQPPTSTAVLGPPVSGTIESGPNGQPGDPLPDDAALDMITANLGSPGGNPGSGQRGRLFDADDADGFFGATLGGAAGGGMGGGRFGGGMGGAFGGGMGGGGNAERLLAALAARRGGMAGGGMSGQGLAPPGPDTRPARLTLFNPGLLLRLLYILFYPLKLILWIIVPVVLLAGMTVFQKWGALASDLTVLLSSYATLTLLMIGLFTVNLASRLAQGVAILAHGGKVQSLGLTLVFGVLPRFVVDLAAIPGLNRQGQLWAHAAPLLARLGLFAGGVLVWAIAREGGTWLPQVALIVGHFGLMMFLVTAIPFVPADGMRWISTYFAEPKLLPKAMMALKHVVTGRALPPIIEKGDVVALMLFAVGTILTSTAAVLGVAIYVALTLATDLGGTGVVIFLWLMAAFTLWLLALRLSIGRRAGVARGGRMGQAELGRLLMGGAAADPAAQAEVAAETTASGRAKVVWGVIAAGLLAVAFLPYNYETGGQVEILPLARGQAVARSDGEILEIMVNEGDIVTRGQIVAQLSSWNQAREVSVTAAMLDGAKANLARLEAGAKPEEIEVARRQVLNAEANVVFTKNEAERSKALLASGTISPKDDERAQANYGVGLATLAVARATLDLVQSGATDEEIAVARAEVDRLTLELGFRRDELERTRIEAPMAGRVLTPDLQLRHGSFLRVGETLLEIENADVVNAAISVPESDIALIGPGNRVRLKASGYSGREIPGTVRDMAQAAVDAGYGSVVRVDAIFENPDGFLRSGMTGYAKIEGTEMRVWQAFMRSILRFFQIQVWSWIP